MQNDIEKAVLSCIHENFNDNSITIEDFPLFPAGKRIIDSQGSEMVFFYDLFVAQVKWVYPAGS
jgi:hypothetical protein